MTPVSCPACDTPLGLFTPRESVAHVNACLDAQATDEQPTSSPTCAVCERDLTALTPAARLEHANRCADSLLPLGAPPQPTTRRPRSGDTAPRRAPAEARLQKGDARVWRLLQLLGLGRYAGRFAEEEIDLVALRLLEDSDFAQLRIPDAARRRIAEAMHSVPILAQIQGESKRSQAEDEGVPQESESDEQVMLTQQFPESKLAQTMRRQDALMGDDFTDQDLYIPTQETFTGKNAPNQEKSVLCNGQKQHQNQHGDEQLCFSSTNSLKYADLSSGKRKDLVVSHFPFAPKLQNEDRNAASSAGGSQKDTLQRKGECSRKYMPSLVLGKTKKGNSAQEDILFSDSNEDDDSSGISSLGDFDDELLGTTQYSLAKKLEKWRRKRLQKEERRHDIEVKREQKRHRTEVDRIHAEFQEMQSRAAAVTSRNNLKDTQAPQAKAKEQALETPGKNCIDLTLCLSSDEDKIEKVVTPSNCAENDQEVSGQNGTAVNLSKAKPFMQSTSSFFSDYSPNFAGSPNHCGSKNVNEIQKSKDMVFTSSDEEILDLICTPSGAVIMPQDEDTRQSHCGGAREKTSSHTVESQSVLARNESSAKEENSAQSRLKKQRKPSRADLIAAIRKDVSLYDDILYMRTIEFEKIHESLKSSGVKVGKQGLADFLRKEGVGFKAERVKDKRRGHAHQYFKSLSSQDMFD